MWLSSPTLQSSGVDRLPAIGPRVETRSRRSPQAVPSGMPTRRSPYPAKSGSGVPTVRDPNRIVRFATHRLLRCQDIVPRVSEVKNYAHGHVLVCQELHLRAFQPGTR